MNEQKNRRKILVAYASQFGSTGEVAQAIGDILSLEGNDVETIWVKDVTDLDRYDAVIIGSAIQYDKWMPEARKFVTDNQKILSKIPIAYFFTCLTLAKRNEKTEQQAMAYADKLITLAPQVQPVGIGRFGGVLNCNKLPFHYRLLFRGMSLATGVKEGDYRNWNIIHAWAKDMYSELVDEQTETFLPV